MLEMRGAASRGRARQCGPAGAFLSRSTRLPPGAPMQDLTTGSITRLLLKTMGFMLLMMVFQTLYVLVDLYWVGRLGTASVAAVGIAGNLMFGVLGANTARLRVPQPSVRPLQRQAAAGRILIHHADTDGEERACANVLTHPAGCRSCRGRRARRSG